MTVNIEGVACYMFLKSLSTRVSVTLRSCKPINLIYLFPRQYEHHPLVIQLLLFENRTC